MLNLKLCGVCLSSDQSIQTGNTLYSAMLYSSCHLWVWVSSSSRLLFLNVTVSVSVLTAYNKLLHVMRWGQITCTTTWTSICNYCYNEFYHWKKPSDLNVKYNLIDSNWFSEWSAMSLCWRVWLHVFCLKQLMKSR